MENDIMQKSTANPAGTLDTWHIMVAGVALVVAASTLVSDFTGYFTLGYAFAMALAIGFLINLVLAISVADLSVAYPKAGALYDYARAIIGGKAGRFVGTFLGLAFYGMFALTASGETAAGAFGLKALTGGDLSINVYILACGVAALLPNIFGLRTAAWASAGLLVAMLGIRWCFGLAGFLGLGQTGIWSLQNLDAGVGFFELFGEQGILVGGLAAAFWSFVGIEFACSLAEEVKVPSRALPRGLLMGLLVILATSWVMGLGVTGTAPLATWQAAANGPLGYGGEAPQLAVGRLMFGGTGHLLMAIASVAATVGTLTVAYAAMPRILYSMARNGQGAVANWFGTLHPRFRTPVNATIFTFCLYQIPSLISAQVIDWVYSAAYAWIILYVIFHVLAVFNRIKHPGAAKAFQGRWFVPTAGTGLMLTGIALYYAFQGAHAYYGMRAAAVLAAALVITIIIWLMGSPHVSRIVKRNYGRMFKTTRAAELTGRAVVAGQLDKLPGKVH